MVDDFVEGYCRPPLNRDLRFFIQATRDSGKREFQICFVDLESHAVTSATHCGFAGSSATEERVEYAISGEAVHADQPLG